MCVTKDACFAINVSTGNQSGVAVAGMYGCTYVRPRAPYIKMPLKVGGNLLNTLSQVFSRVLRYTREEKRTAVCADTAVRDAQHTMPTCRTAASVHRPAHALLVTAVQDEYAHLVTSC